MGTKHTQHAKPQILHDFMTTEQVASYLQYDKMTILRWIKAGKLKAKKMPGGSYRISASDIEKLMEAR